MIHRVTRVNRVSQGATAADNAKRKSAASVLQFGQNHALIGELPAHPLKAGGFS